MINAKIFLFFGWCLFLLSSVAQASIPINLPEANKGQVDNIGLSSSDFLLKNYSNVAISTDLEPDDVLALAIIFKKANAIYAQSENSKYPIDLIIVGEGNSAIKRLRMEKLINEYFDIPDDISIKVVEGKSTENNIFPYDGEEIFAKESLNAIPFPDADGSKAVEALHSWAKSANQPFIIQIKPAQELLYLSEELANKITVLFYGSFNLRKTIEDNAILSDPQFPFANLQTDATKLEMLVMHLSEKFSKIAILESFGVLEDQSCVCGDTEWTNNIREIITHSENKFLKMFKKLSSNWNVYILNAVLEESEKISSQLMNEVEDLTSILKVIHLMITQFQERWFKDQLEAIFQTIFENSQEISSKLDGQNKRIWSTLLHNLNLAKKMTSSEVQFTLSDVLVAMATTEDPVFFQADPIHAVYNEHAFLVPVSEKNSNVVYYSLVDKRKLALALEQFLLSVEIED